MNYAHVEVTPGMVQFILDKLAEHAPCFDDTNVSADTTVYGPVRLCGEFQGTVVDGVALSFNDLVDIGEGVSIELGDNAQINFDGVVVARGSATAPIEFGRTSSSTSGMDATVNFGGGVGSVSTLTHVSVLGGILLAPNINVVDSATVAMRETIEMEGVVTVEGGGELILDDSSYVSAPNYWYVEPGAKMDVGVASQIEKEGYLQVDGGGELTINKGARFIMVNGSSDVIVDGRMDVLGTQGSHVTFSPPGSSSWPQVLYRGSSASGTVKYADIDGADYGIFLSSADDIDIKNVDVTDAALAGITLYFSSNAKIRGGRFHDSYYGTTAYDSYAHFITDNRFIDNVDAGINVSGQSSLNFGEDGTDAYVKATGNKYGVYADDASSVFMGDENGPTIIGGSNEIQNNSDCDVKMADSTSNTTAMYTWWGGVPPSSQEFCSSSYYQINYDNWLSAAPTFPSGQSYRVVASAPTLETAPLLEVSEVRQSGPSTGRRSKADFVSYIRSQFRDVAENEATSMLDDYVTSDTSKWKTLASLMKSELLMKAGQCGQVSEHVETLLTDKVLSFDDRLYGLRIIFNCALNGFRDKDAASRIITRMAEAGADSISLKIHRHLLELPLARVTGSGSKSSGTTGMNVSTAADSIEGAPQFSAGAYPNPFNPTAIIEYNLPKASHVEVVFYNILGQEVRRLVDADMVEGRHQVTIDGSGLASGTYLYRITAGENTLTGKLLLLK